jgi:hypothetical protein
MTQDEKRIKLAEAGGWIYDPQEEYSWQDPEGEGYRYPRDYFNDLNAVHELENVLNDEQARTYAYALYDLADGVVNMVRATAAQRAEALGRTLNLWEAAK